jgi:hypothetical protein
MASLSHATAFLFDGGTPASRKSSPIAGGKFEVTGPRGIIFGDHLLQLRADEISRLLHLDFPVRTKKFPFRFHREFRTYPRENRLFFNRQLVDHPLNLRNSRFFSLIDGNLTAETGSIPTASTTTQLPHL